jgi:hypothetical protein
MKDQLGRRYFWCGHRCKNAKSAVFDLDISVKLQKRVFEPLSGLEKEMTSRAGLGLELGLWIKV